MKRKISKIDARQIYRERFVAEYKYKIDNDGILKCKWRGCKYWYICCSCKYINK